MEFNSRLNILKGKISELEGMAIETSQNETERKMSRRKSGQRIIEESDDINWTNVCVIGAPGRKNERGQKNHMKK